MPSPRHYALALERSISEGAGPTVAFKRLIGVLAKKGDSHRAKDVLREFEKLEVAKSGGKLVEVEFARAQGVKEREKVLTQFSAKDRVVTRISPELVAGTRITVDGERELDVSLAGKMRRLFA